jgi:flagellar assembly protein FliH
MSSNRLVARHHARTLEFQTLAGGPSAVRSSEGRRVPGSRGGEDTISAVEREAFQKGFEAGRTSGLEMAEKKVEAILGRFTESLQKLAAARAELVRATQQDLVRLAVEIARKLVHRELTVDPEIIVTLVRVALDRLSSKAPVVVYLNPEDLQLVESQLQQNPGLFGERDLVLKARADLRRGDCQLESPYGNVDASISEQFKQIEDGLLSEF